MSTNTRRTGASGPSRFDKFATAVANFTAKAWFFAACVVTVVLWVPSFLVFHNVDTWQLLINTLTTIVTFLLVALLQNTQARDTRAIHGKLNAIAEALADIMEGQSGTNNSTARNVAELRRAVGLEHREGT